VNDFQPVPRPARPITPLPARNKPESVNSQPIKPEPINSGPINSGPINSEPINTQAVDTALFAWEWARMLVGTSWVVDDRTVIAEKLRGLTLELVQALEQDQFASEPGIVIGESLVKIGFAAPDALARTTTLITQRLLIDLGLADRPAEDVAELGARLAELVGMLCLGFVRAVRDRTLEEQEAIRGSAMLAWQRARADQRASALRDPLTGLLSRDGFIVSLADLIERYPHGVVGACQLTLDGFDALDHGLGRTVGDRLLATVGRRLAIRFDGDTELIARVGRDEFIVAAVDEADLRPRDTSAQRLAAAQRAVRESIVLDGRSIVLSTSSGLIARPADRTDPDGLLRDVDLAASWGRARGPGGVAVFDGARAAREVSDLALTADLPEAIEHGRLGPHYQPIISLSSGRIEAVEALARWSHTELGLLSPDRFLPLAERGGLIGTLGRAILLQSCIQGQIWRTGLVRPPVVAVNLAAVQLTDRQTVRNVVTVLEQTGLPPGLLQLEITEHAALNEPSTLRIIRDLAGYGVGLALDDFGTGRAHLAHLPELPAHGVRTLKVPADFLRRPPTSGADGASDAARVQVFAAMIDLAHELGMQVTVEGVETSTHDALVRQLGADLAQGSHYGRPEDAVAIGQLLGMMAP
jgi:diguanylate cyclase (GGDEF)-like protein